MKIDIDCKDNYGTTHIIEFTMTGDYRRQTRHSPAEAPAIDIDEVPQCCKRSEICEVIHAEYGGSK